MKKQQFISILDRYLKNQATAAEQNLLHAYYHLYTADDDVLLMLKQEEKEKLKLQIKAGINSQINKIDTETAEEPVPKVRLWPRMAIAAAAVAAIVFGIWFFNANRRLDDRRDLLKYTKHDIAPGRNGATITLGNGQVIELSGAKKGVVIGQDLKYADHTPVINANPSSRGNERSPGRAKSGDLPTGPDAVSQGRADDRFSKTQTLTASTAKGQMYEFTLPDGTHVWLNAASKISFPSQFNGKERKIILEGEGYFEVAHNEKMPFIVESKAQEVRVLGTHFNISSYADDAVTTTTLLQGSVKVSAVDVVSGKQTRVLRPNQQAIQNPAGSIQIRQVDASAAVDWKNGDFVFQEESLASIMRKVSRWYGVDVIYGAGVDQNQTFGGKVSRTRNISQVIMALQATQALKFKIEGKKIYIIN